MFLENSCNFVNQTDVFICIADVLLIKQKSHEPVWKDSEYSTRHINKVKQIGIAINISM